MELGPIQKAWVQSLREHPERQMTHYLGRHFDDGSYKACCLGEAYITLCKMTDKEVSWIDGELNADFLTGILSDRVSEQLGLYDGAGSFVDDKAFQIGGLRYYSLAAANDDETSWLEIADFIEANPEVVFSKSV